MRGITGSITTGLVLAMTSLGGAAAPEFILGEFDTPAAGLGKWSASGVNLSVEPRSPTDLKHMLKVVFDAQAYPGLSTVPPLDWSPYEALRFTVWTPTALTLHVRIDDPSSTDYQTRYNREFLLEPGRNLCQIEVRDIGRRLDLKKIRSLVLFAINPPAGLTMHIENVVLGPMLSEQVPFIPYAERKDLQPTLNLATPHLPFARGLAGGPLRAFVLTGIAYGREAPELMQRMDLAVSLMTWDRNWDINTWGMGDFYGQRGHAFDYVLMQRYLASSLQGPETFETMFLPTPQGWDRFPAGAREAIMRRVREDGAGLVLVMPYPGGKAGAPWPEDLKALSALVDADTDYPDPSSGYMQAGQGGLRAQAWRAVAGHPIANGVPLDALPVAQMTIQPYRPAPGATVVLETDGGIPVLAVKPFGRGRVATFAWRSPAITPEINGAAGLAETRPYRYWEAIYSLIARTAAWTAGRELTRQGNPVRLAVEPGNSDACLEALVWKDGAGRVTDWALEFTPPVASPVARLDLEAPRHVRRGAPIGIRLTPPPTLAAAADGAPCRVRIELLERSGEGWRTLEREETALAAPAGAAPDAIALSVPSTRVRRSLAVARVTMLNGDHTLATGEAEVVVAPVYEPGQSRWNDYEVLMWPVDGLPFLASREDRLMQEFGSSGVMTTRWRDEADRLRWARAGLRIMPHEMFHRNLHLRNWSDIVANWNRTRDRQWLIRNPSYANPGFLAAERDAVTQAVRTLLPYDPTNYVLADEPSITSYSNDFDYDFHPANVAWFRRELEKTFGTVAALNDALGTDAAAFDEIEPPTTDEARKTGRWGLWNVWRRHNDFVMAEGYRMYREAVLSVDPNGTISVSGTQTASAYTGFDWGRLTPLFGTMQGYDYGYQDLKRISFNPDLLHANPAGYGRAGRAVDHQVWSKLVDHGAGHVLFWWIAFRNPDLSFCRSARDYMHVFGELRAGIGRQYMQARRHLSPVGIMYAMNSLRAARAEDRMQGRGGEFPETESTVAGALIQAGFDPVFVTEEQVADGELARRGIRALFLPMTLSLGYGEKPGGIAVRAALQTFTEGGGLLCATHTFRYDEFLQPREAPAELTDRIVAFDTIRDNLPGALAGTGAKPWTTLRGADGGLVPGARVTVHRLHGDVAAHLVTAIRAPLGTKDVLGADGVVRSVPDDRGGREVEPCVLDISAFGPVTVSDVRSGGTLAATAGRLALDLSAGDARAVALLPYTVQGVDITLDRQDRMLVIEWRLRSEATAFAPHVVRIETGTEGRTIAALSANAVTGTDGRGRLAIPLAFEEENLPLRVTVRDMLTGSIGTAEL